MILIILLFFYEKNSKKKIYSESVQNLYIEKNKIQDQTIEYGSNSINIAGIYAENKEYISDVNISIILVNDESQEAYRIYTEFVEVCDEQTVDEKKRDKAGYFGRIFYDSCNSLKGDYHIYILNRSIGKNELLDTGDSISI